MEGLEHEAHSLPTQQRQRVVIEGGKILPLELDESAIRTVEAREQIQQRGLADARFTHDRDVLAATQSEIESVENRLSIGLIPTCEALDAQNGGVFCHGVQLYR
jgi:hypothetical protein